MTIGTTISAIVDTANGATTAFAYPFLMPQAADALVSYTPPGGTLTVLGPTEYQLTGAGNPAGGTIVYPLSGPPLAAGTKVIIARILPLIQAVSVAAQGPTFAAIEQGLDYGMMVSQQLQQEINDLQFEISNLTSSTSSTASTVSVGQIANIPALRAYTGSANAPLWLVGYSTAADGGEGMFAYIASDITSPDNGGTIIVDGNARRWYRETGGLPYSVKWFGATGLGVADDTVAMQNCISAASAAVHVPIGTYRITQPLTTQASIQFIGDGTSVSIISPSTSITCFGSTANGSVTVKDMGFTYPASATGSSTTSFAIALANFPGAMITASAISNVVITNAPNGVVVQTAPDFVMDRVFVYGFSNTGATILNSLNVAISDSGFYGSGTTATAVNWAGSGGLRLQGTSINTCLFGLFYDYAGSTTTGKLVVTGNGFEAISGAALQMTRSSTGTVNSAVFNDNAMESCIGGLYIPHDGTGAWIVSLAAVGNTYVGLGSTADFGFKVDSVQNFIISANALDSATTTTQGIVVGSSASMGIIQGNNLAGSYSSTISVSATASSMRVLDNVGYNPVGSSTLSPGVSPWSYTASTSPQTLYLSATTSINSVVYKGTALLPAATGANGNFTVGLGPNETVVVSYSGAMTANVMTH